MWLKDEGFMDRVKGWWASYQFQGTPSFVLSTKLRALKKDIKTWNKNVFGNVGVLTKEKLDELKVFEIIAKGGDLSEEEKERKRLLCRDLERSLLQEEICWRQKSIIEWLKVGDKCTNFFHLVANLNRRFNTIDSLLINGSLSSNPVAIREHVVSFYESMFVESMPWRPRLDDLDFEALTIGEASSLEAHFLEREAKEVIFGIDENKAPGRDGFSLAFFQACRDVLREDIMAVFFFFFFFFFFF
jgi:hypothetical protein